MLGPARRIRLGLLLAMAVAAAAAPIAHAATVVGRWGMDGLADGTSESIGEGARLEFTGGWEQATGVVGGAVRFTSAPSFGVARGTEAMNPGTRNFAMSLVFTSRSIPTGAGYSGNLMQKGLAHSPGQVKLQLVPNNGGSVDCVVKGGGGATRLTSKVVVDDGKWHTASCWRAGSRIGLTVDAYTKGKYVSVGSISNAQPVRVGNKSPTAGSSDQHFGRNDCSVYLIRTNARAKAERLTPC